MPRPAAAVFLALAVAALGQQHDHGAVSQATQPAPLLAGLGRLHHSITTSNPLAQRYFDQGLTLVYAFNHEEATRSFEYVAKLDPECAMAYWGIALARGPNYNEWFIDASREKLASEAVQKAQQLAAHASASRAGLYSPPWPSRVSADPKADQKKLGADYRDAMRELMQRYPNDLDAAVLFADAAMDLHAWMLWKRDGQPEEGTHGSHRSAGIGAQARSGQHRRESFLYSRKGRVAASGTGHGQRAEDGGSGARRGTSGSHAGAHLHSHRRLSCRVGVE